MGSTLCQVEGWEFLGQGMLGSLQSRRARETVRSSGAVASGAGRGRGCRGETEAGVGCRALRGKEEAEGRPRTHQGACSGPAAPESSGAPVAFIGELRGRSPVLSLLAVGWPEPCLCWAAGPLASRPPRGLRPLLRTRAPSGPSFGEPGPGGTVGRVPGGALTVRRATGEGARGRVRPRGPWSSASDARV